MGFLKDLFRDDDDKRMFNANDKWDRPHSGGVFGHGEESAENDADLGGGLLMGLQGALLEDDEDEEEEDEGLLDLLFGEEEEEPESLLDILLDDEEDEEESLLDILFGEDEEEEDVSLLGSLAEGFLEGLLE